MSGQGIIITPGVVTNTNSDGQTTQTPVIVTNVDPSGGKGACQCVHNTSSFGNQSNPQTPMIVINLGNQPQAGIGALGQYQNTMGSAGTGLISPLGVTTPAINQAIANSAINGLNTPLAVTAPAINPLMAQSGYTMNPVSQLPVVVSAAAPDGTIIQAPVSAATITPTSMFGSNYSGGASVVQTPAVVSNVTPDGLLTQTPAVVTNTAQLANINPSVAAAALTANNLVATPNIINPLTGMYDQYGQYNQYGQYAGNQIGQYGPQYGSYDAQNYGTGY